MQPIDHEVMSTIRTETETLATTRGNPDLPRVLLVEDQQAIRDIIVPYPRETATALRYCDLQYDLGRLPRITRRD